MAVCHAQRWLAGSVSHWSQRRAASQSPLRLALLPLPREECRQLKLILHSELRRRAASRRALPCPSSVNENFRHAVHCFETTYFLKTLTEFAKSAHPLARCVLAVSRQLKHNAVTNLHTQCERKLLSFCRKYLLSIMDFAPRLNWITAVEMYIWTF